MNLHHKATWGAYLSSSVAFRKGFVVPHRDHHHYMVAVDLHLVVDSSFPLLSVYLPISSASPSLMKRLDIHSAFSPYLYLSK